MTEIFDYIYNYYVLRSSAIVPGITYVMVHLLFIVPINFLAFFIAHKSASKPKRVREKRMVVGAIIMLVVIAMRTYLHYLYQWETDGINGIIKFEMSEIAMYLLILAVFFIKKDWFYSIAYTTGLISWFACFIYPYTVFADHMPFQFYSLLSFIFHALNGYLAAMIIVARGYEPKVKHFYQNAICSIFLFIFIYIMCEIMDQNFMVMKNPSKIPFLNMVPVPYHIAIMFIAFNAVNVSILAVSQAIYKKINVRGLQIKQQA